MVTLRQVGYGLFAALFVTAIAMDTADARRGGGGGGGRGGGGHAMRAGGMGGGNHARNFGARTSQPIANRGNRFASVGGTRPSHPIAGNRPNRPGGGGGNWNNGNWNNGNWNGGRWGGYWPGYAVGVGVGAVGAGLAYSNGYGQGYYGEEYPETTGYQSASGYQDDAVAYCAQRYRSYDPATQTYLSKSGRRVSCP